MIHVSTEFKELMKERTDYRCFGELTLTDGSELTLGAGDFTMGGNSVTDGAGAAGLPLGAAVCRTARLSLADPDGRLAGYDLFGAKLRLYLTFPLSETEERIELGTFTVTEPESRGETVTVTAADDMYRTDRAYTTALAYPATLGAMFREICDSCGVPYSTAAFVNSEFAVAAAPEAGYTCRQMLGYIAMLAGGNARVHRDGRMEILSYDPAKAPEHELGDWIGLTPDTDDVTVTGLETVDSEGNKVLEGSEGYVLTVDDPLMAGKEAAALAAMGRRLIGLKVRRFEGEYVGYPLVECMDTARITDRKGRTFETVLTDVTFVFGGRTALSDSAAPAARSGGAYATPEAKARQAVRQLVAAERTAREAAVEALNERLAKASGMYGTRQVQPDGSSIWYLHDKPELTQSQAVMKLTSEAIGFSTDGGKSYPFGFSVTGEMVMGIIRSEGISADWVKVGGEGLGAVLEGFVGRDENDRIVSMLNASADQINIKGNRFVLDSDNFKVAADGTVTMTGANVSGDVRATSFRLKDVALLEGTENFTRYNIYPESAGKGKFTQSVVSMILSADNQIVLKGYISAENAAILNQYSEDLQADKITVMQLVSGEQDVYGPIRVHGYPTAKGSGIVEANLFKGQMAGKLTFTGGVTGSYDGSAAKTVNIPNALSSLTDGVWKAGQSLSLTADGIYAGMVSGDSATVGLEIPVGKPIAAASVRVTSASLTARGVKGTIFSNLNPLASGYSVNAKIVAGAGLVAIYIKNNNGPFSNTTGATPVVTSGAITLSFTAAADEPLPGPEIFADGGGEEGPSVDDGAEMTEQEAAI